MQIQVFFDFDGTLVTCESIDSIAEQKGVLPEVESLTKLAMDGDVLLESIFSKKIEIIAPSHTDIQGSIDLCLQSITPGALETIETLRSHGATLNIISGGFKEVIDVVAETVFGISKYCVFANSLEFNEDGTYKRIHPSSPCATSDGKPNVIQQHIKPGTRTIMIGDGMTDAACREVCEFIGFGGVSHRLPVEAVSSIYIKDMNLTAVMPYIFFE
jgi:phosphoserine phosphatase